MSDDDKKKLSDTEITILRAIAMANAIGWRPSTAALFDILPLTEAIRARLEKQPRSYRILES